MNTLIFIGTLISLTIYLIKIILRLLKHGPIGSLLKSALIIMFSYCLIWILFYSISSDRPIPFGTDVCFDDWCATITTVEHFKNDNPEIKAKGQFLILHIKMSNHARGIAQKPSDPRVKLIDSDGTTYTFSQAGQQTLEKQRGQQIPIDSRLELHQSLETQLVFDIPNKCKDLKAVIEEGPFITKLLFCSDREVFLLK